MCVVGTGQLKHLDVWAAARPGPGDDVDQAIVVEIPGCNSRSTSESIERQERSDRLAGLAVNQRDPRGGSRSAACNHIGDTVGINIATGHRQPCENACSNAKKPRSVSFRGVKEFNRILAWVYIAKSRGLKVLAENIDDLMGHFPFSPDSSDD